MNPIFSVVVRTMLSLKRICPKCKRNFGNVVSNEVFCEKNPVPEGVDIYFKLYGALTDGRKD